MVFLTKRVIIFKDPDDTVFFVCDWNMLIKLRFVKVMGLLCFFFFYKWDFLELDRRGVVVIEWLGGPLRTSIMSDEMLNLNHFSWNIPDNKTHKLMSTNKRPLKQKSAKETLP